MSDVSDLAISVASILRDEICTELQRENFELERLWTGLGKYTLLLKSQYEWVLLPSMRLAVF